MVEMASRAPQSSSGIARSAPLANVHREQIAYNPLEDMLTTSSSTAASENNSEKHHSSQESSTNVNNPGMNSNPFTVPRPIMAQPPPLPAPDSANYSQAVFGARPPVPIMDSVDQAVEEMLKNCRYKCNIVQDSSIAPPPP